MDCDLSQFEFTRLCFLFGSLCMTMNARGTGVTGELWEKLVNLENLEVQRAVELILWGCTGRNPTPEDLQTWPLAVFAEVQVQNEPSFGVLGAFEDI